MATVVVYHKGYGCDTGCCGHVIELTSDAGEERSVFEFSHPGLNDDARAFAEELVREHFGAEHVADLDWDSCVIVDD